jgi:predicted TIM-barrel fold metal-dependent hydrolase
MSIPPIISVDDHVVEPPDLWQRWLPARLREAGPRVVRVPWEWGPGFRQRVRVAASGPEADCWVFGDNYQFVVNQMAAVGMGPGFFEPAERLADMDVINVERSLCFPNSARFCGQMFLWMDDRELALASVKAYNDWMIEEWAGDSGGRLLPLCLIPLWDSHEAAAEVRRNAERGCRAVAFSEMPAALDLPSIHSADGYWMPFFEACDETGTVICLHIGSSSTVPSTSADAPYSISLAATSFNAQLALSDWLFSGLLARFSRLKLAFSESQIGWMPFVLERCDRIWRTGNKMSQIPASIVNPPSSYMEDRVYGCFFEDDFGIDVRATIGINQITLESDYPHQDSTWPYTVAYVDKALSGLSENDIYKIVRGNAIRMLDLPEQLPG